MGGMHGMGPIVREDDEPVFHGDWEGRVLAMFLASSAWGGWNIDRGRFFRESIPGPRYLNITYYEIWLDALIGLLADAELAAEAELASGDRDPAADVRTPGFTAEKVPGVLSSGGSTRRETAEVAPRFVAGDRVVTHNDHPATHTRLPRYARGRVGVVDRDHGIFVLPDTNANRAGETPQHVYSVRFDARELWGDAAGANDAVYIDLWDNYLEHAG